MPFRAIAPAAVAASLIVAPIGCSGRDVPAPSSAPVRTAEAVPRAVTVEVRDSSVVGGVRRVSLRVGAGFRLTVRSDVADEVHVHGIDERAEVEAGGEVTLDLIFPAPGIFEVELEGAKVKLLELEVR